MHSKDEESLLLGERNLSLSGRAWAQMFFKSPKWCWCRRALEFEFYGTGDFPASNLGARYRSLHILDLLGGLLFENIFEHKVVRHLGWHLGVFKFKGEEWPERLSALNLERRFQTIPFGSEWNRCESAMRNFLLDFVIPSGLSGDHDELGSPKRPSVS